MYVVLQTKKHVVMIASQLKMTTIAIQKRNKNNDYLYVFHSDPDTQTMQRLFKDPILS